MKSTTHYTDAVGSIKSVAIKGVKQHWIEYQLLDELGAPLADLPYRATNEAVRSALIREYCGRSDADGIIRIEGLHPIPLTLFISANPLAEMMQTRQLRAVRPEPRRPSFGSSAPLYGPQRSGFSPIEQEAVAAGHGYSYLRIGQLCDEVPVFEVPWEGEGLPDYHFPDPQFRGFTLEFEALDRRNVIEVCPFRAWSLVLHHRGDYSLANAYNLGLMSILAYSKHLDQALGAVKNLFLTQCLDMSRTPRVWDSGQAWPCLVTDLPFDGRYSTAVALDTGRADPPRGDTQLFYAYSATQMVVAWRGTEFKYPFDDAFTDAKFRPVKPPEYEWCDAQVACGDLVSAGKMHLGFRDAYGLMKNLYALDLREIFEHGRYRSFFVCGHSLGGALALIHATSLRALNPLLYTYGMPRTFTREAICSLGMLKHFRHVNDTDIVARVPLEADLDSWLYNVYGPLGTLMGFTWSLRKAALGAVFGHSDPFMHHGEIAMFFMAEHHVMEAAKDNDRAVSGLSGRVAYALPQKAKLFLVPSVSEEDDVEAEQAQHRLQDTLTFASRAKFFPPGGNVKVKGVPDLSHHSMTQYQPYLHNQLLECIDPELTPGRRVQLQLFEAQMEDFKHVISPDEMHRNRAFLHLHRHIGRALQATLEDEGGPQALERFAAVADPEAYYEKVFG